MMVRLVGARNDVGRQARQGRGGKAGARGRGRDEGGEGRHD